MVEEPERQPYVHWTTCYDYRGDVDYRRVFLHFKIIFIICVFSSWEGGREGVAATFRPKGLFFGIYIFKFFNPKLNFKIVTCF